MSSEDNKFDGAFAGKDFETGEVIESGVINVLSKSDGDTNNFGSSRITLYQKKFDRSNTKMIRDLDKNIFKIVATRDIKRGEELFSFVSYKLMLF